MEKIELTKVTGRPDDHSTTQIHEFDLSYGKLVVLVSVTQKEANISRMETIRGVVNFFHHEVSDSFDFEKFKSEVQKNVSTPPFDVLVFCKKDDNVYLFSLGNVSAYIFRDNKDFPLIEGKETLHSVSGKIKDGDVFVLGTKSFFDIIKVDSILDYYNKRQLENLETDFEVGIDQSGACGLVGGVILTSGIPLGSEKLEEEVIDPIISDEEELDDPEINEEVLTEPNRKLTFPDLHSRRFSFHRGDVYEARGRSKKTAAIGALLLVILSLGIFVGLRSKKQKDESNLVSNIISSARESLSQARAISLVNKGKARELIYNAQQSVLGVSTMEDKYPEIKSMQDEIHDSLGDVGGIYELKPDTFSDLSLITEKMKADEIAISDDLIAVLGKDDNRVITIALPGKRTETISGSGSFNSPEKIALYSDRVFVWGGNKVTEYNGGNSSINTPAIGQDGLIEAFASNLYVLDKTGNQILRYSGNETGFSEGSSWLAPGVSVDLSKATSMAIDGSIWVLSSSGKLTKLTLGNPQSIELRGLDSPLSDKARLYTSDETSSLYILDPSQKSVYVFEKGGEFVAKYTDPELSNATNLVVSESQRIMILTDGQKLLSIPLRHLK